MIAATPAAHGLKAVPMLRGRIVRIDGEPVGARKVADREAWMVRSHIGVTYAAAKPENARLVAGEWWPADYRGEPLISFDAEAAEGLGIGLGDTLTINLLGREVTGRIASLREIEWLEFDINFVVIFSPGVLEAAIEARQ